MDASFLGEKQCQGMKKVVSKYGVSVVCNEEDKKEREKATANIIMPASEECEKMKTVASKVGVAVVCDENV